MVGQTDTVRVADGMCQASSKFLSSFKRYRPAGHRMVFVNRHHKSQIVSQAGTLVRKSARLKKGFNRWFFEEARGGEPRAHHQASWWKVMCLTGVDYFSTLGYQPGIAFLAAGILSPLATLVVVLITLFGLVPLYGRVARESPHGEGSIAMLEKLLPGWRGKALVLVLLGFAATDFIITITLSAADATAHVVENPIVPSFLHDRVLVTIAMLAVLGAVFLKGFREAIGLAVAVVVVYLLCNAAVLCAGTGELIRHPELVAGWQGKLFHSYGSIWSMIGVSLILFPKLALGMSGFETGVAVMPLVKGYPSDTREAPLGRIRNTRLLLGSAAAIMAVCLMFSSLLTTVLIPAPLFEHGGEADGRALAYLAHLYLGHGFGTLYDLSTILILWFAGASAMAGLLNLVPRYLPRYGMAPAWAQALRPLVVFFTAVGFVVTIIFRADVDAQAGAYATGVLVLFTSAAFAVVLTTWKEGLAKRLGFFCILLVFCYTSIANMVERPEGLQIASFFIATVLVVSIVSRALRSTELRVTGVRLDESAEKFIDDAARGEIRLLAHRPGNSSFNAKESEARRAHSIQEPEGDFIFLEVDVGDASEFNEETLDVRGYEVSGYRLLRCKSPAVPNAIAAILLHVRERTGKIPHVYMGWTEGPPLTYILKYIFLGDGETAPITREILRSVEPDPDRRPWVHVS